MARDLVEGTVWVWFQGNAEHERKSLPDASGDESGAPVSRLTRKSKLAFHLFSFIIISLSDGRTPMKSVRRISITLLALVAIPWGRAESPTWDASDELPGHFMNVDGLLRACSDVVVGHFITVGGMLYITGANADILNAKFHVDRPLKGTASGSFYGSYRILALSSPRRDEAMPKAGVEYLLFFTRQPDAPRTAGEPENLPVTGLDMILTNSLANRAYVITKLASASPAH